MKLAHLPAEKQEDIYLHPILSAWMKKVFSDKKTLKKLVDKYGSPLNLNHPDTFAQNVSLFKKTLSKSGIAYKIFFARKPNKCIAYVKEAKMQKIGIDTASYNELRQCIEIGYPKDDIILTSAVKDQKSLKLAIENDITIIADNYDELYMINKLAKKYNKKQEIGIRVSGFVINKKKLESRFGFDVDELDTLFEKFFSGIYKNLTFTGFHFHLNGYSAEQRAEALLYLLTFSKKLKKKNIITKFIDIGGGIPICYLASEAEWKIFEEELRHAVLNKRSPITYGNNGLGYINVNGKLEGTKNYYPFFNRNYKNKFLEEILSFKKKGEVLLQALLDSQIELRLEPGRSLLDLSGVSVARVAFRKKDQNNDWLVGLEMNMTQLSSSSADFLVDPIVIYFNENKEATKTSAYFVGSYCLERDVILKRKITLNQLPQIGDLVVFINTAGYMMHFFESRSHQFDLAQNIIVQQKKESFRYMPEYENK